MVSHEGGIAGDRVTICLRQRPLIASAGEGSRKGASILVDPKTGRVECSDVIKPNGTPASFKFDKVYDANSTTDEVFKGAIVPLVGHAFRGGHSSVFAYGPEQSGKTFTINGLLIRSFARMQALSDHTKRTNRHVFRVSCVEIHESNVYDLFGPVGHQGLHRTKILQDQTTEQYHVQNLREKTVSTSSDFERLMKEADKRRQAAYKGCYHITPWQQSKKTCHGHIIDATTYNSTCFQNYRSNEVGILTGAHSLSCAH